MVLVALASVPAAHAIEWRVEPTVSASATLTDNVNQSATNEKNALILTATPAVTLYSEGSRRVRATLQYGLTGVTRIGEDQSDNLYHNLNAAGSAELVPDSVFIDGDARVSQELTSLLGSPAAATVNDVNRTTTGSYSVSPYVRHRFGTFADFDARYTLSGVLFGSNAFSDLLTNAFDTSLNSGTRFVDLSWGLDYYYRDVSARNVTVVNGSYTYERANLGLRYALTRTFRLIGNVGQEKINYEAATATDLDHSTWSAGFDWAPSRRTSLEATMGERFFGNTYSLSANYRGRQSLWTASYVEDVNDISQATLTQGTLYIYLCGNQFVRTPFLIAPAPGCILVASQPGLIPSLSNGLYVGKTFTAGVNWGIRKISYSINAYDISRAYLLQNNLEDHSQGVNGSVHYRLSPLTDLFGNVGLTRNQIPAALSHLPIDRDDDLLSFILGVNHQFGSRLRGALTAEHYRRNSNDPTAEYRENRLTATVNMSF